MQESLKTSEQNKQIKDTTDLLAFARVAIYPVSAQGVAIQTTGDASDHYGTAQNALPGPTPGTAPPSGTSAQSTGGDSYQYGALSNDMRHGDNAHAANFAAMNTLASATGGVMMPTSNDLNGMLSRAISDGSQYYTLSYAPTNTKTDGSFRRIVVTLTPSAATQSAAPHTPGLVQRTPEVVKQAVKAERRIDLDVVVSDAFGHAVSGLQSSGFTILDQNNSQSHRSRLCWFWTR